MIDVIRCRVCRFQVIESETIDGVCSDCRPKEGDIRKDETTTAPCPVE
jgi:Zn finger protein HypA/HybF involved in hydrogenase expression